jgi:hypothetical protein
MDPYYKFDFSCVILIFRRKVQQVVGGNEEVKEHLKQIWTLSKIKNNDLWVELNICSVNAYWSCIYAYMRYFDLMFLYRAL